MSNSRRSFLQSGAALAAGLTGGASAFAAAAGQGQEQAATPLTASSELQVPR
jgi:hypothetical protein